MILTAFGVKDWGNPELGLGGLGGLGTGGGLCKALVLLEDHMQTNMSRSVAGWILLA